MPGKFNFTVFGGLEKKHYESFRLMRKKYDLIDRGMIECLIELGVADEYDLATIVERYKITAPVDAAPIPEVVP